MAIAEVGCGYVGGAVLDGGVEPTGSAPVPRLSGMQEIEGRLMYVRIYACTWIIHVRICCMG